MADPGSQTIGGWAIDQAEEEWKRLDLLCIEAIRTKLAEPTDDYIADLVSRVLLHVAAFLKDSAAIAAVSGEALLFEIDDEDIPYVRAINRECAQVLKKLRTVDTKQFEIICSQILNKFGAGGEVTGNTGDMGVDFIGHSMPIIPDTFPTPTNVKILVVGQAKRHIEKNISESELRKFIGGATRRVHLIKRGGNAGALTPVVYAFWTSSDFEQNARSYAQEVGLWLMNGITMAMYMIELDLLHHLEAESSGN